MKKDILSNMNLAINTGSLANNTSEALERAADLGFRRVEIDLLNNEFNYGYRRRPDVRFYRQLQTKLKELMLSVWSVTAPQLSQEQMFSDRTRKEILKSGAVAAGLLGAKVFVVQPADIFKDQETFSRYVQDLHAPAVMDGFDEAWVQVVNRQMTMALLNQDYWIGTALTNQAERLAKISDDLAIGCALDIRRAIGRNDLKTWIDLNGDRLAVAYAYDIEDDGAVVAPKDDQWKGWLATLGTTRTKCVVLRSSIRQDDAEITASRHAIEEFLG